MVVQREVVCHTYSCLRKESNRKCCRNAESFIFFWEQITEDRKAAKSFMLPSGLKKGTTNYSLLNTVSEDC